jgi:hypothetical protein
MGVALAAKLPLPEPFNMKAQIFGEVSALIHSLI